MGDRPPTGEPEKEKEEEREEKRRKKRKKKKKKNSSGRLGYWACSVRRALPRAGSARRVLRAAAGAGPGGERRAAKRGVGPEDRPRRRGDTALGCLPLLSRCRAPGSLCELHAWEAALPGGGTRTPAARAAPRGEDANAATFGAVQPSPFCTRADDGSGRGRRRAL